MAVMFRDFSNHIFLNAQNFYKLAIPAFQDDKLLQATSLAVVTNLALFVELTLKACDATTITDNKPGALLKDASIESKGWGHDLKKVFDELPPDTQQVLTKAFQAETGKEIQPLLTECRDYFESARYAHEKNKCGNYNIGAIYTLATGLLAVFRD